MLALLIRDLRLATRAGGGFGLGLAFFLIVCTLVPFGVGPEGGTLALIAPGILWVGALLACLLSLDRIFALDWEDGSLDLLATAPVPMEEGEAQPEATPCPRGKPEVADQQREHGRSCPGSSTQGGGLIRRPHRSSQAHARGP